MSLYNQLYPRGLLCFRGKIKGRAAFFGVKNKNGDVRLIVDAREAKSLHAEPPRTSLSTLAALTELDLSLEGLAHAGFGEVIVSEVHGREVDVDDCSYNFDAHLVAS